MLLRLPYLFMWIASKYGPVPLPACHQVGFLTRSTYLLATQSFTMYGPVPPTGLRAYFTAPPTCLM